jgi:hypothetical protein
MNSLVKKERSNSRSIDKRSKRANSNNSNISGELYGGYRSKSKSKSETRKSNIRNQQRKNSEEWGSEIPAKRDGSPKPRKHLNFLLFIPQVVVRSLEYCNEQKLNSIRSIYSSVQIYFHESLEIPEVEGKVLVFESDDIEKKCDACKEFFKLLQAEDVYDKMFDKMFATKDRNINALVLVPNGLVSMVIGTKGKQIINLAHSTKTLIAVNQPVYKMLHRTISIAGGPGEISSALKSIYQIMEDRYYEVTEAESESKPLDLAKVKTTVSNYVNFFYKYKISLALNKNCVYTISSKGPNSFADEMNDRYNVNFDFKKDTRHRFVDSNESIVVSDKFIIINIIRM